MWTWLRVQVDAFLGKVHGKPGRMDTATRMAMDAEFSNPRAPFPKGNYNPAGEINPLEELERIVSIHAPKHEEISPAIPPRGGGSLAGAPRRNGSARGRH